MGAVGTATKPAMVTIDTLRDIFDNDMAIRPPVVQGKA